MKITTHMGTDSVNSTEGMQHALLRHRSLLSITHSDRPFQCESVLCVRACVVCVNVSCVSVYLYHRPGIVCEI